MTLPLDFHFSQNKLQDYIDCPRRFELRHLLRQAWPSPQTEPVLEQERVMEQGQLFHKMVHQSLLGIPQEQILQSISDPDLLSWWINFQNSGILVDSPANQYVEYTLSAPMTGSRILAKYDLLALEPGKRLVIYDWKTSRKRSSQQFLHDRIQSKVYPCILMLAGSKLNGGIPPFPTQVELIYWFTDYPEKPVRLTYSNEQYQEDTEFLTSLIREIKNTEMDSFPYTLELKHCLFCQYRSLCNRGTRAGSLEEMEDDLAPDTDGTFTIDFGSIGEISI
jgi:CRISPR/Cas system-associated exonuclease Cas4 (RecB family)